MSIVDAPPGIDFAGPAAGEFRGRRRPQRLARLVLYATLLEGAITVSLAARKIYLPGVEALLVGPLVCVSVAVLGWAVRSATIRVDRSGVRWGWGTIGFRMAARRLRRVVAYRSAVALVPPRGSAWFLSERDWENFDGIARAIGDTGMVVEVVDRDPPIRARLQSYGMALDILLLLDFVASGALLFVAGVA